MLIDSGAEVNVLSEGDWKIVNQKRITGGQALLDLNTAPQLNVRSFASSTDLELICTFKAWIEATEMEKPRTFAEFVVVKNGMRSLLGRKTAIEMKLLAVGLGVNQISSGKSKKFPSMPGVEVDFDIDESVVPRRNAYVSIPAHYREAAIERLREMEESDIIEQVKEAPRWISGLSAVPKGKTDFRLIVNMRGPNKAIQRQFHQMPRIDEIKTKLNGARFFTKLDLSSAFHHVIISEKSRELTTFMAPNGMFRFKRLVFGVNCAPEIFQRLMEEILKGIPNTIVYIDDILIYAGDIEHLKKITEEVINALQRNNLTINTEKCEHEKESLVFLGHQLSARGLDIDERKVKDIAGFREPKSLSELRSFLGLASYVSSYIPRFADLTEPLWRVTNKGTFAWTAEQAEAFRKVKSAIIECTTSQGYFDTADETFLYTDASPHALGAVLVQKNSQQQHRIVSFASKTLTQTERKYAQTQREALAVVWGTEHFYYFLLGHKFTIRTDAQGIAFIFNKSGCAPKRLMKRAEGWAMRLDSFDYDIEFVKGSDNIADPSSRLYEGMNEAFEDGKSPCEIATITLANMPAEMRFNDDHLPPLEVAYQTARDDELTAVLKALKDDEWNQNLSKYKSVQDELHSENGIVMRLGLAVIPNSLRQKALTLAHKGHPGISKMKSILRERVWWPKMGKSVETWVESCKTCVLNGRKERPTPMERTKLPEAPWDFLALDFCGPFHMYGGILILVMLDYFSRFMVAMVTKSTDFASTRSCLESIFDLHGYPETMKSDNGPPFNSDEYRKYCISRGITPVFTWPLTPQQNGMAERAMQTINKAMQSASVEGKDYRTALAAAVRAHNSATHRVTNEVPSDVMFARKLRRSLPLTSSALYSRDCAKLEARDWEEKQRAKEREDKKRKARDSRIMVGDKVVLRRTTKLKGQTNYDPQELEVTEKRKGDLTMTAEDGRTVKRHITLAKKIMSNAPQAAAADGRHDGPIYSRPQRTVKPPQRYVGNLSTEEAI